MDTIGKKLGLKEKMAKNVILVVELFMILVYNKF